MVNSPPKFLALMYHSLCTPTTPTCYLDNEDPIYVLDTDNFRRQIEYLSHNRIPVLEPRAIEKGRKKNLRRAKGTAILLTFDDGHISNYQLALPILEESNLRSIFFITVDWIGQNGYLDREMIQELERCGMVIGSHGKTHRFLTEMAVPELKEELIASKKELEEITGHEVNLLSIPGGRINRRVRELAFEVGYSMIFTSSPVINFAYNEKSSEYGRFPITHGVTFNEFQKIVHGKPSQGYRMRVLLPFFLRKILTDRNYRKIRNFITSITYSHNK